MKARLCVLALALVAGATAGRSEMASQVRIREYLGRTWEDELVSYPLPASLAGSSGVRVSDEDGVVLPSQVHDGRVYILLTLPAGTEKILTFSAGEPALPPVQASAVENDGFVTLDSGLMALRLPAGDARQAMAGPADRVRGPVQGVKIAGGEWIGSSRIQAPVNVTGMQTRVAAKGPLFAEASVSYFFENGREYTLTARVTAGRRVAVIYEEMDLNPANRYVIPSYADDADASEWEWWSLADYGHMAGDGGNEQPANAIFSFRENLEPNQCVWVGGRSSHPRKGVNWEGKPLFEVESGTAYAPLTYEQDERFNRLTGWWLNSFSDRSYVFGMYNDRRPERPLVSLIMGRPSRNVNPNMNPPPEPWIRMVTGLNDMRIHLRRNGDIFALAPICLGSREWLLMVEPQSELPPREAGRFPNGYAEMLRHSYFPLDKIKDWTFDWPEKPEWWPRIFCKAGAIEEMKARVASATGEMARSQLIPATYRADGRTDDLLKQAQNYVETYATNLLSGRAHGGINWFHASLRIMQAMPIWEAVMAAPDVDPSVRARLKAYGAFIAQYAWDEDYWPHKRTCNGWGSANMGVLAAAARVMSAAAMAGHPMQDKWLKRCRGYLDGNLRGVIADDGSGVSCPHYLGASIDPIMYMALALKYGGGYDVFRNDARWPRFCRFMMDILTPPDPRSPASGPYYGLPMGQTAKPGEKLRRNLWPLGHTSRTEPTGILDMLALGMLGVDEKMAGMLRYMAAEMGQASGGAFVAYAILQNTVSRPVEPEFGSRFYPSYGAILRDGAPDETWFAIRYSKFAFDHFQFDTGAFTLFGRGMPLMMDFGSMYSPENHQPVYHNRPAWDVGEGELRPCPGNQKEGCFYRDLTYFEHRFEPWTCKAETFAEGRSPTDAYGVIKSFSSLGSADYLLGETEVTALQLLPYFPDTPAALAPDPNQKRIVEKVEPFTWHRRVLMAKGKAAAPAFLLVRDDMIGKCPPVTVSHWVMADDVKTDGLAAKASGQFGVDLDLLVLEPSSAVLSTWSWSHRNWGGETQMCIRVRPPSCEPVSVLLYPRRKDEAPVRITPLAGGTAARLEGEGWTAWAVLSEKQVSVRDGEFEFEGTAGLARKFADGSVALSLSEAGSMKCGRASLRSRKPEERIFRK